ncbi:MAG TPA: response regulator [Caulobacterales bacterium]|nr:response regulator [Caulobacterales bacterium]
MPETAGAQQRTLASVDVLIVDDNAPMRSLLRSVLRAVGVVRIREATDGRDALALLDMKPADVILLDHAMPGMTGLEVARALRASPDHPAHKARIVMITGYGDRTHVSEARDAGVDEFLVKPITTRALLLRLEAALARGRDFVDVEGFQGPDRRRRVAAAPGGRDRRTGDETLI